MAKKIESAVARDVAADLLGDTVAKVVKKPAGKAVKVTAKTEGVLLGTVTEADKAKAAKAVAKAAKATKATKAAKAAKGKPSKAAAKPKATAGSGKVGRPSPYTDDQKIVVVEAREGRGNMQKVWEMVAKSKTVGQYKALRAKAGLEGLGGIFASFVKDGNVKVK